MKSIELTDDEYQALCIIYGHALESISFDVYSVRSVIDSLTHKVSHPKEYNG